MQIELKLIFSTVVRPVLCAETEPVVATMGSSAARAARWEKAKLIFLPSVKSQFLPGNYLCHALGVLQAVNEKGPGVQVQADKGLRCEQELSESVPVLPPSKVPRHGHAQ